MSLSLRLFLPILCCFSFSSTPLLAQSIFKDAILNKSCYEVFKKYIKPGHVINFESPDAKLDGKFMLIKNGELHFVEAKATPRSSSKLSLKKTGNDGLIAVRDEKGQLIARLKIEEKTHGQKEISCS